jgi:hypothetical protein
MNALEEQLSALLKEAPGEPPVTVDADALVARGGRRRRYLAPALAAAAMVAVAVPVAVLVNHDAGTPVAQQTPTKPPPTASTPHDPKAAAIGTAQAAIDGATVLPGASRLAHSPLALLNHPPSIPGAQHVQRTRFWTAPGTVDAAIAYLQRHPPAGFRLNGSGSAGGPGVPANGELDFQAGKYSSLLYNVVADHGGVAVRADAQVLWAPARSPADTVPTSVNSVDVVVVRQNSLTHQGAPTVQRTLTGVAAQSLSDIVNRLPRAVPVVHISCPAMLGGTKWYDRLVFHSSGATVVVVDDMTGCPTIEFTAGHRKPILLAGDLNKAVLHALGLPDGYGGR